MLRTLALLATFALLTFLPIGPVDAQEDAATGAAAAADESATEAAPAKEEGSKEKAEAADPSGSWRWQRDFNGQTMDFVLKLDWDGKKLTGEYTSFGDTSKIEEAKFDKDQVSFEVRREFNGNEFYVDFDGKVKGDDIEGTIDVDFGDGGREFEWVAKRSVQVEDVLGSWDIVIDTPRGEFESTVKFDKDGDKLQASLTNDFGTLESEKTELKDNQVTFHLVGGGDRTFSFVYKAKPRGNKISGVTDFDFGGNTGQWTFAGKRVPAKKDANGGQAAEAEPANERPPLESADE